MLVGALQVPQVRKMASYFAKLVSFALLLTARSTVGASVSDREKAAQHNALSVLNHAVKIISNKFNTNLDKGNRYDVALLNTAAKEKVLNVFHNTIMRSREGGGINSVEGLLECRRVYRDELNVLSKAGTENDVLAVKYLVMLDLSS